MIVQTFGFSKMNFKKLKGPRNKANAYIGSHGEYVVVNILAHHGILWEVTTYKHPVDILIPGFAIEVKTINHKCESIHMTKGQREFKTSWAGENYLEPLTILVRLIRPIVIDCEGDSLFGYECEVLCKPGFKRFRPSQMDSLTDWLSSYLSSWDGSV